MKRYEKDPKALASSSVAIAEKSKSPRAEVSWPVSMITTQGLFEGQIKDISKGGALIQCAELPKTDEPLELSIEIPDLLLGISATVGKVRLNIDDRDKDFPSYDLAVRFLGIDSDQPKHLYNAIEPKAQTGAI